MNESCLTSVDCKPSEGTEESAESGWSGAFAVGYPLYVRLDDDGGLLE